jgi:hypothetical protein
LGADGAGPGGFRGHPGQQRQVQLQHVGAMMPGLPGPVHRPGVQHVSPGLMPPGAEMAPGNPPMG